MAITIYKYAYHVDWEETGVARPSVGSATGRVAKEVDLSNYYTKADLITYEGARIHYSNIVYDGILFANTGLSFSLSGHVAGTSDGRITSAVDLTLSVSGSANYSLAGVVEYTFDHSLEEDSTHTVTLVNDEGSPGNSEYYGTNASGTKGWYALPEGGANALDDLTDVSVDSAPTDDELLSYDSATSEWINKTASEAGVSEVGHSHTYSDITDFASGVSANETSHSDVVVDGDFSTNGILRRTGAGTYGSLTGSSSVDTVEDTLTQDSTHIPTSNAVYDAIGAIPSGGDGVLSAVNATDITAVDFTITGGTDVLNVDFGHNLQTHDNVTLTSLATDDILKWSGTAWVNVPIPTSGTENAYSSITDGTNTANASGSDTFQLRTSNNILSIVVTDNDATYGDNALFTITESNINHDNLTNTHNLTTDIDHDQLTNYDSAEHFLQSAISIPLSQINDINATATEIDAVADLSAITTPSIGWVYHITGTSPTTAGWGQLAGSEINNDLGWTDNVGTVTSVGLSLPTEFNVTGSPVTGSGTLTGAWADATQNYVFAAPSTATGTPSFRALVDGDMPTSYNPTNWDSAYTHSTTTTGNPHNIGYADITDFSTGVSTYETSHADVLVDGDFSSAGLMKTDGSGNYSIVTDNSSNWDTAYGWGDHAGLYLELDGTSTMTGDLEMAANEAQWDLSSAGSRAIWILAGSQDVNIWEVGNDAYNYGFYLQYEGSGTGNDNALHLYTHGQTGTDVEVYEVNQDGNVYFKQNVSVTGSISGTNTNWDAAYTHSQVTTGNPHSISFTDLTSNPTTLSGYGISDTKVNFNTALSDGSFAFDGGAHHDGFSDFVSNEHINHTSVSISTGSTSGLDGGGDISSTRNIVLNFTRLTNATTLADADEFAYYDSGVGMRALTYSALKTALNNDLSFNDCSFGTDNQIPYTNSGGTDFDYTSGFTYTGAVNVPLADGAGFMIGSTGGFYWDADTSYFVIYGDSAVAMRLDTTAVIVDKELHLNDDVFFGALDAIIGFSNSQGWDLTVKASNKTTSGVAGDLKLAAGDGYSGATDGSIYLLNGTGAYTITKGSETDILYFDSSTGKISYGEVPSGGEWTTDTNGIYYSSGNVGIGGNSNSGYELYVTGTIYATSDISAYSDIRAKEVVEEFPNILENIDEITPIAYKWKEGDKWWQKETNYGLSAQEVLGAFPHATRYDETDDKYSLKTMSLIAISMAAVKELKAKIVELEDEIKKLKE